MKVENVSGFSQEREVSGITSFFLRVKSPTPIDRDVPARVDECLHGQWHEAWRSPTASKIGELRIDLREVGREKLENISVCNRWDEVQEFLEGNSSLPHRPYSGFGDRATDERDKGNPFDTV